MSRHGARGTMWLAAWAVVVWAPGARAERVTIQGDVAVGPALHLVEGAFRTHRSPIYGLKLGVAGIIDREVIRRHRSRVPARYRRIVERAHELRVRPLWYLPDTVFVSPKVDGQQMYGVTFRPIGFGLATGRAPRLGLDVGLLLTYAYYRSETIGGGTTTHFLRPGLGFTLDLEIPITRSFLVSIGWQSQVYVPQAFGSFDVQPGEGRDIWNDTIWHIGQAYLLLHFRFPYTTNI